LPYSPKKKIILGREDVEDMIEKAYYVFDEEEKALMVASLVSFLWLGGTRISEALAIRREDIKMDEKYLYATITPLKQWKKTKDGIKRIKQYFSLVFPRKDSFFAKLILKQTLATNPGEKLWDIIRQTAWVYIVKLNPGIYPHTFRHSRATIFADKGTGDSQMRKWFGWSKNSPMPYRYTDRSKIEMARIGDLLEE